MMMGRKLRERKKNISETIRAMRYQDEFAKAARDKLIAYQRMVDDHSEHVMQYCAFHEIAPTSSHFAGLDDLAMHSLRYYECRDFVARSIRRYREHYRVLRISSRTSLPKQTPEEQRCDPKWMLIVFAILALIGAIFTY